MSRQYEIAVLAALLLDETSEYISLGDINPDIFQFGLKDTAEKLIQYKKDGGSFDPLLLHKLIGDMGIYKELIEATGKVVVFNAQKYLSELKYSQFEKTFFEKMNRGDRPTPDDLRKGLELIGSINIPGTLYDFNKPVSEFHDWLDEDKQEYFTTGIKSVDDVLGRIIPEDGEMISIGGATGLGKTTMALRLLANFMLKDIPCLYMSCEMGFNSLFGKMVAQNSYNVSAYRLRNKILSPEAILEAKEISNKFYKRKSLVNVTGKFTVNEIKKCIKTHGSRIIFIDYVQSFKLDIMRGHSPASANSELAKSVKDLAVDTKTIIFCLSQLNTLGNLRESASWEDASDVVCKMFVTTRKEKQGKTTVEIPCETPEVKGIDFRISKNRFGDSGVIKMLLHKKTTNIAPGEGMWE